MRPFTKQHSVGQLQRQRVVHTRHFPYGAQASTYKFEDLPFA